jgi:3-hydroxyacyl-CoA dehydrogenase
MGELKRAAIIGTGTMGPGMGAVLARAGIQTALYDVSADALERARTAAASPTSPISRPRSRAASS